MNEPNKTLCCGECGNDNIEFQVWADENNNVLERAELSKDVWCNDCKDETRPVAKDKNALQR